MSPSPPGAPSSAPIPRATGGPSIIAESPAPAGPPAALLAAEGGDPVTGQVGSYTWGESGSDSPWLAGAPMTVGAGELLSLVVEPAQPIATWRARSVPSAADGPEGAALLGEGGGTPSFAAPERGSWTVEVRVVFADGAGDVSYFWAIEVS